MTMAAMEARLNPDRRNGSLLLLDGLQRARAARDHTQSCDAIEGGSTLRHHVWTPVFNLSAVRQTTPAPEATNTDTPGIPTVPAADNNSSCCPASSPPPVHAPVPALILGDVFMPSFTTAPQNGQKGTKSVAMPGNVALRVHGMPSICIRQERAEAIHKVVEQGLSQATKVGIISSSRPQTGGWFGSFRFPWQNTSADEGAKQDNNPLPQPQLSVTVARIPLLLGLRLLNSTPPAGIRAGDWPQFQLLTESVDVDAVNDAARWQSFAVDIHDVTDTRMPIEMWESSEEEEEESSTAEEDEEDEDVQDTSNAEASNLISFGEAKQIVRERQEYFQNNATSEPSSGENRNRLTVFRVPGLSIMLRTNMGLVSFQPAFLSCYHLHRVIASATELYKKGWLMKRKAAREQWRTGVVTTAVKLAGNAWLVNQINRQDGANSEAESEDDGEAWGMPAEAAELMEELGEKGGSISLKAPAGDGLGSHVSAIAVGAITIATQAAVTVLDAVDTAMATSPFSNWVIGIPNYLTIKADYLDDHISALQQYNQQRFQALQTASSSASNTSMPFPPSGPPSTPTNSTVTSDGSGAKNEAGLSHQDGTGPSQHTDAYARKKVMQIVAHQLNIPDFEPDTVQGSREEDNCILGHWDSSRCGGTKSSSQEEDSCILGQRDSSRNGDGNSSRHCSTIREGRKLQGASVVGGGDGQGRMHVGDTCDGDTSTGAQTALEKRNPIYPIDPMDPPQDINLRSLSICCSTKHVGEHLIEHVSEESVIQQAYDQGTDTARGTRSTHVSGCSSDLSVRSSAVSVSSGGSNTPCDVVRSDAAGERCGHEDLQQCVDPVVVHARALQVMHDALRHLYGGSVRMACSSSHSVGAPAGCSTGQLSSTTQYGSTMQPSSTVLPCSAMRPGSTMQSSSTVLLCSTTQPSTTQSDAVIASGHVHVTKPTEHSTAPWVASTRAADSTLADSAPAVHADSAHRRDFRGHTRDEHACSSSSSHLGDGDTGNVTFLSERKVTSTGDTGKGMCPVASAEKQHTQEPLFAALFPPLLPVCEVFRDPAAAAINSAQQGQTCDKPSTGHTGNGPSVPGKPSVADSDAPGQSQSQHQILSSQTSAAQSQRFPGQSQGRSSASRSQSLSSHGQSLSSVGQNQRSTSEASHQGSQSQTSVQSQTSGQSQAPRQTRHWWQWRFWRSLSKHRGSTTDQSASSTTVLHNDTDIHSGERGNTAPGTPPANGLNSTTSVPKPPSAVGPAQHPSAAESTATWPNIADIGTGPLGFPIESHRAGLKDVEYVKPSDGSWLGSRQQNPAGTGGAVEDSARSTTQAAEVRDEDHVNVSKAAVRHVPDQGARVLSQHGRSTSQVEGVGNTGQNEEVGNNNRLQRTAAENNSKVQGTGGSTDGAGGTSSSSTGTGGNTLSNASSTSSTGASSSSTIGGGAGGGEGDDDNSSSRVREDQLSKVMTQQASSQKKSGKSAPVPRIHLESPEAIRSLLRFACYFAWNLDRRDAALLDGLVALHQSPGAVKGMASVLSSLKERFEIHMRINIAATGFPTVSPANGAPPTPDASSPFSAAATSTTVIPAPMMMTYLPPQKDGPSQEVDIGILVDTKKMFAEKDDGTDELEWAGRLDECARTPARGLVLIGDMSLDANGAANGFARMSHPWFADLSRLGFGDFKVLCLDSEERP